jgi:hypothetical protein
MGLIFSGQGNNLNQNISGVVFWKVSRKRGNESGKAGR